MDRGEAGHNEPYNSQSHITRLGMEIYQILWPNLCKVTLPAFANSDVGRQRYWTELMTSVISLSIPTVFSLQLFFPSSHCSLYVLVGFDYI